jgi:hypothetical protein
LDAGTNSPAKKSAKKGKTEEDPVQAIEETQVNIPNTCSGEAFTNI